MASSSWVAEFDIIVAADMGQSKGPTTITDHSNRIEGPMALHQASPTRLLIVLSAATLPTALSGVMLGPLVAFLLGASGWRLPFAVVGTASLGIWILVWIWCPGSPRPPGQPLTFSAHYREVGAHSMVWSMLAANALQQMVLLGMFSYLAAHLMHTFQMPVGDTVLPLALAGVGIIAGSFLGGRADHRHRLAWLALACLAQRTLQQGHTTTR